MKLFILYFFCLTHFVIGQDPGSLVRVTYQGVVGINLEEAASIAESVPDFLDRYAGHYKARSDSFWDNLATLQGKFMEYKQVFRQLYYDEDEGKGSLTTPPENLWVFNWETEPELRYFDGHLNLARNYSFEGYLLSSVDSPEEADPALGTIGGEVEESWILPVDPSFTLAKIGLACCCEDDFPPFSWFSQVMWVFYDDTMQVEDTDCHLSGIYPQESCADALKNHLGSTEITIKWTRVPWNSEIADEWRYGEINSSFPDKKPIIHAQKDLTLFWKFFNGSECELREGNCLSGSGWRRLLAFSSSSVNIGNSSLVVLNRTDPIEQNYNLWYYSECHGHIHFFGFVDYIFGTMRTNKAGFCLQDTWRYYNNEGTSLRSVFYTCDVQGGSPGWGDDYIVGVPCNWVDVTSQVGGSYNLTQVINPYDLICEGTVVLDENGNRIFDETEFLDDLGKPIHRVRCDEGEGYNSNNVHSTDYTLPPVGSYVTQACFDEESSSVRDCGFSIAADLLECTPGKTTTISLKSSTPTIPQAIRICESSHEYQQSIACEQFHALANEVLVGTGEITFECPAFRSNTEPGGLYSILIAPVLESDPTGSVSIIPEPCPKPEHCPKPEPCEAKTEINFNFEGMIPSAPCC